MKKLKLTYHNQKTRLYDILKERSREEPIKEIRMKDMALVYSE